MRLRSDKQLSFQDAARYARELLGKAGRQNGSYLDRKYVKLAGHAAWTGVLVAVDEYLLSKGIKKGKGRKGIEWYTEQLSKLNRKLNSAFLNAYDGLHLHLGYDGALNVKSAQACLEDGRHVIDLCKKG